MRDAERKDRFISWDEFHRDARVLAGAVYRLGPWRGIVAVARGGLFPAAILARELNIRMVETVVLASYADGSGAPSQGQEPHILKAPDTHIIMDGAGWLVVDDIADSGRTIRVLRQMLPQACFAAVYATPAGKEQVNACAVETTPDRWLYFPWDLDLQCVPPLVPPLSSS